MEVPQSFPLPQKAVPLGKAEPSQSAPPKGELLRLRQSFRQNRKVSSCAKKRPLRRSRASSPKGGAKPFGSLLKF